MYVGSIESPSTINGCMMNACINFTMIIILTIQIRRDLGSSSSSSNFREMSLSLHEGKKLAKISAMIKIKSMLKITIDTGFCDASDSEERIALVIEENIVSLVYRFA